MSPNYLKLLILSAAVGLIFASSFALGAPLKNHPVTLYQPDGAILHLLVSGDEYFNWIHDRNGYTIIQDPGTGFYTYAISSAGRPVPSSHIVGRVDPGTLKLAKNILPAQERVPEMMASFPGGSPLNADQIVNAPAKGTMNNLVVFIRFSDENEFVRQAGPYNAMFNSGVSGANSMYNYYQEVSYNQLLIKTTFYPAPDSGYIVSYQDSHPRGYYQPYSSANTIGYTGEYFGSQRRDREHLLLLNATNAIASQVPADLDIDADRDGKVDNLCFIVRGQPTAWSSLLWPHMWSLYSQTAYIRDKLVYTYNFQLETSLDSSGVGVLCHEMFHSLGAPDLYHYDLAYRGLSPVYKWDLMESNLNPPQHMNAYMKMRYGGWIASIPTISAAATYTLNALTSSAHNAYRINSPNSATEYFVVEYRKREGTFESSLPDQGILIYRINTTQDGQGNSYGPPDEVYVYRPNGSPSANGSPASANFNANAGRTAISDCTNPSAFLSNGNPGGLKISDISAVGATMSFTLGSAINCTLASQVTNLYPVSGAAAGGPAVLWAEVKNTGSVPLPGNAAVWFYVDGAGISNQWVGYASVSALAPGARQWYAFNWNIPGTVAGSGTYTYWARVYTDNTAISEWSSSQIFAISPSGTASAQVPSLYPVSGARLGGTARLWAQVRNTGDVNLPSNALVWFYVDGGGISNHWVGSAVVAGLSLGAATWYSFDWSIPSDLQAGAYTYWAQVYTGSKAISDWSSDQAFVVSGDDSASGFNEQFNGAVAPDWIQDKGAWFISNGWYHAGGAGLAGAYGISTYNAQYADLDFTSMLFRYGSDKSATNIIIRASGTLTLSTGQFSNCYKFQYTRDGYFSVFKIIDGVVAEPPMQDWTKHVAIRTFDHANKLRVVAKGSSFWFYILDTLVWSGTDTSHASGRAGFSFYTSDGSETDQLYVDYAELSTGVHADIRNLGTAQ